MDLAAHTVTGAGIAGQAEFSREVAVLVRPAGGQDSGRTFQIAAVEIHSALSVRCSTLGFGRKNLLKRQSQIGAPGVAHGKLEHRTQLHAVRVNGVVAHVRSAHVAIAGNVKALIALSVIEVGQEHARANRLRQIPVVVGAQMCAPVDSGSVVVNIGSGNVRVELVSKQTDLEVTREVQAFEGRHGVVTEDTQTAVVVAAAACFGATRNMRTGVVTAVAHFNEGTQTDEQRQALDKLHEDAVNGGESLEFVFQDGAQWTYLGISDEDSTTVTLDNGTKVDIDVASIAKRISKITLENKGIVNLFDENIKQVWKDIGLWDRLIGVDVIQHDYVRIGDLKGTGGIFRLDLDSDAPEKSDMIFIEGTSETTQTRHWIEPYRPSQLVSVSADNTLTFALTQKDANNVTFADKMNIYGETLYDYELYVNHDEIGQEDLAGLEKQIKSNYEDFDDFDPTDYQGGTEWFIERVVVSKSAATVGVNNAGWAAYDAIMQMDRRDRRLRETAFVDSNSNDGLWVRMQYGRLGAEDAYKSDTTTVHVGYERQTSANNRFGVSVSYMDGSPDFENLKGGGDLERYEIAVYDTLTFGNHYLDFVGRFGHLSSDFSSSRSASSISTQGEFSTNYFGVSAEYGYTLKSAAGFFAEPQLQMQATRLEGYNYGLQRDMSVDVEQETALVGRAGLRLGKHFAGERSSGEIYVRGDILHQFTDGQFGHIRDLEDVEVLHWGDAGTWTNFGVGGYYQFANKFSMQLDLEKSAGGEQLDAWMVSGHLVYNF